MVIGWNFYENLDGNLWKYVVNSTFQKEIFSKPTLAVGVLYESRHFLIVSLLEALERMIFDMIFFHLLINSYLSPTARPEQDTEIIPDWHIYLRALGRFLKSGGGGGGKELINVVGIISPRPSWDRVTDLQKLEGAVSPSLRPLRQTRYWNMFKISRIRVSTFAYKWVLFSFPLRDHSITTCTRWGRGGWKILQIRKYFCLDYCLFLVEIIELQS